MSATLRALAEVLESLRDRTLAHATVLEDRFGADHELTGVAAALGLELDDTAARIREFDAAVVANEALLHATRGQ